MELSSRIVAMIVLTGMVLGIFWDVSHLRKQKKRKKAAPPPTPGQKVAKMMEQYIDSMLGE